MSKIQGIDNIRAAIMKYRDKMDLMLHFFNLAWKEGIMVTFSVTVLS